MAESLHHRSDGFRGARPRLPRAVAADDGLSRLRNLARNQQHAGAKRSNLECAETVRGPLRSLRQAVQFLRQMQRRRGGRDRFAPDLFQRRRRERPAGLDSEFDRAAGESGGGRGCAEAALHHGKNSTRGAGHGGAGTGGHRVPSMAGRLHRIHKLRAIDAQCRGPLGRLSGDAAGRFFGRR